MRKYGPIYSDMAKTEFFFNGGIYIFQRNVSAKFSILKIQQKILWFLIPTDDWGTLVPSVTAMQKNMVKFG